MSGLFISKHQVPQITFVVIDVDILGQNIASLSNARFVCSYFIHGGTFKFLTSINKRCSWIM